jgi:hypothetical protein
MKIRSEGQADLGPLLGEISGRWYWDAPSQSFKPNRRHPGRDRRRGFNWLRFWRKLALELAANRWSE